MQIYGISLTLKFDELDFWMGELYKPWNCINYDLIDEMRQAELGTVFFFFFQQK